MRFAIFPVHLSKVLRLPRKSDARSYEVLLRLSLKMTSANLKISGSKMPPLRKSAPGPPNSSDEHVSCAAPATENASLRSPSNVPRLPTSFGDATKPLRFSHFWQSAESLAPAAQNHLQVVRACGAFNILAWKCASRHNGVHFFASSTSKSAPSIVHFHFEMCFAPQRRAIFHLSSGQMAPHPPL